MSAARALRRMFGGLLLAIGLLMTVSCGLCTGYFGLSSLADKAPLKTLTDLAPYLAIGAFATAVVDIARRDGVGVPSSALSGQDGDWSVEVVGAGDRIERRAVVPGLAAGDDVEISDGLKAGEAVVARASAFLRPGDVVRPMPAGDTRPDRAEKEASR